MGIGGLHPDFASVDEVGDFSVSAGRGFGKGQPVGFRIVPTYGQDPLVPCGACRAGEHSSCWEHNPPRGVPFLTCPCRQTTAVARGGRYVVVPGISPSFVPSEPGELTGLRPTWTDLDVGRLGRHGWVIFDQVEHHLVAGWFADQRAALGMVECMNGPTAVELANAAAALRAAADLL